MNDVEQMEAAISRLVEVRDYKVPTEISDAMIAHAKDGFPQARAMYLIMCLSNEAMVDALCDFLRTARAAAGAQIQGEYPELLIGFGRQIADAVLGKTEPSNTRSEETR